MCDPELLACTQPCPCWDTDPSVQGVGNHDGHCCMLRDGHQTPPTLEDWRTGADECQPPAQPVVEAPC